MIAEVIAGTRRWHVERGEALRLLASLPDASVDAVITDPPYSSGGQFRSDRALDTSTKYVQSNTDTVRADFHGDNRDQRSYGYWCALWLSECLRIAKPGAPICVFTDWRQLPVTTDAIQAGGWIWRGVVPWNKTEGTRPQMGRFRAQCEYVVWGSKGAMGPREEVGVLPGFFEAFVKQDDKHHQTGKPTRVMQEIARICLPGGLILDPFAGSGTTGVAALLEGRRFIGSELSEEYFAVTTRRLTEAEREQPLLKTKRDKPAALSLPLTGGTKCA